MLVKGRRKAGESHLKATRKPLVHWYKSNYSNSCLNSAILSFTFWCPLDEASIHSIVCSDHQPGRDLIPGMTTFNSKISQSGKDRLRMSCVWLLRNDTRGPGGVVTLVYRCRSHDADVHICHVFRNVNLLLIANCLAGVDLFVDRNILGGDYGIGL